MHELLLAAAPTALAAWTTGWAWIHWRLRRPGRTLRLGQRLPDLQLPDPEGQLKDIPVRGRPMVVLFMSNSCPGVKAYDERLRSLQSDFSQVDLIGINPMDEHLYPQEGMPAMALAIRDRRLGFPYLKDADGGLARLLGARCTPHVFLFDGAGRLRYDGRIDDALLDVNVKRRHLREAILDVLAGRKVRVARTMPLGCAIDATAPSAIASKDDGRPSRSSA